jgi:hypothetical protein
MLDTRDTLDSLDPLSDAGDTDGILDVLLEGWEDDYEDGRALLLRRLLANHAIVEPQAAARRAYIVYRTLIGFGEELADMRWVRLAVECRDALLYGY